MPDFILSHPPNFHEYMAAVRSATGVGDSRLAMANMEPDSVDSIVCDPPYELSNDGQASAYRIAAEFMFPEKTDGKAEVASGDDLSFLITQILSLRHGGSIPRPSATVPEASVALNHDASAGNQDIEYVGELSPGSTDRNARVDGEAELSEHLGCLRFELTDETAFFHACDRIGAGFFSGSVGIGFRVQPASVHTTLSSGFPIVGGHQDVRARDDAAAALVCALATAEHFTMPRFHLARCPSESLTTEGALIFCALLLLAGAKAVRAPARAGSLPAELETRRIRVIDESTHRALTFDVIVHPQTIAGKGFMGQVWDGGKVAYDVGLWKAALRIAKPGAHLVAFGSPRTWHRLVCAIEDAGWEIRDQLSWMYGNGMPKSLNVSREIDRRGGYLSPGSAPGCVLSASGAGS